MPNNIILQGSLNTSQQCIIPCSQYENSFDNFSCVIALQQCVVTANTAN